MAWNSLYFNSLFDFLNLVVRVSFFLFGGVSLAFMDGNGDGELRGNLGKWYIGRVLGERFYD